MNNQDMKIYFDGSHYIGIPKGAFPSKKGRKRRVVKPVQQTQKEQTVETPTETTKERFEKAYKESQSLPKKERKAYIKEELKDHFDSKEELNAFVDENVERAKTNAIKRKVRLMRKLRLQDWDYFCTFTYSDELHTEESFREKLSNTLKHLVARNGWKYVGVWERGNDTNRLHIRHNVSTPRSATTFRRCQNGSNQHDYCQRLISFWKKLHRSRTIYRLRVSCFWHTIYRYSG